MKKDTISIVFICDDGYAMPCGVAIYSLTQHLDPKREYKVYIIGREVSEDNIARFKKLQRDNLKIEMIDALGVAEYSEVDRTSFAFSHISNDVIYKINIADVFEDLDKILYLDGDVLINDDLTDLYDSDVSESYAAVSEYCDWPIENASERLGVEIKHYFNAGVMLLNTKRMRKDHISEKSLPYVMNSKKEFAEQEAFNAIFAGNVVHFKAFYNAMYYNQENEHDETGQFYTYKGYIKNLFNQKIIHFLGPQKPWLYKNVIGSKEWLKVFKESPWKDKKLKRKYCFHSEKRKIKNYLLIHNHKTLPRKIKYCCLCTSIFIKRIILKVFFGHGIVTNLKKILNR